MQIDDSWEMQSSGQVESAACTIRVLRKPVVGPGSGGACKNLSQMHKKSASFSKTSAGIWQFEPESTWPIW